MSLLSWFRGRRSSRRFLALIALTAALAAACKKEPAKLPDLVPDKDRAAAVRVVEGTKKPLSDLGKLYANLNATIDRFYRQNRLIMERVREYTFGDRRFFEAIVKYLNLTKSIEKIFAAQVKKLKSRDLKESTKGLETAVDDHGSLADSAIAGEIDKGSLDYIGDYLYEWGVEKSATTTRLCISQLQQILKLARELGYPKTAEAASNALVNIRGDAAAKK